MAFDVEKLFEFCVSEIRNFAKEHTDEEFYAFAIDASLLCFNSNEQAQADLDRFSKRWTFQTRPIECWEELTEADLEEAEFSLKMEAEYGDLDRSDTAACLAIINKDREQQRAKGNPYLTEAEIKDLRDNTGDWAYQGFSDMTSVEGFDYDLYDEHYYMSDEKQLTSAYGQAMDALVEKLKESGVFGLLKTSSDFVAKRVEHDY